MRSVLWRHGPSSIFHAGGRCHRARRGRRCLAPSPHNSQPWLFRVADTWIELYLDTKRNTRALDPYLREAHLGLGCALENVVLAARAEGFAPSVWLSEGTLGLIPLDPTPDLVVRVTLSPGPRDVSPLYTAIPHRHTNRTPYDTAWRPPRSSE